MNTISEYEQRELFFINYSNNGEKLFCEVPVFCRSIDVVKWDLITNSIIAIEFKLTKWKKALEQAINIAIAFDYIEICIMEPKTVKGKNIVITECKRYGVGVYFTKYVNGEFSVNHVLEPEKLTKTWEIQKLNIINYLKGV